MSKRPKPIVLTVLDGWGYLMKDFPNTLIQTSGPAVGLPVGQMGNSEVGHLNIGAGRIVHMDSTRIDQLIAEQRAVTPSRSRQRWRSPLASEPPFRPAENGARK
jgi:bisphosphoglycerate-independent phosphoglycerate mutase (AlkP superfamily)